MSTIRRLLIANRGEIACRIARTARARGIATIAVYTDVDRGALHVSACDEAIYIGEEGHGSPYLNVANVVNAAKVGRADAVHPGYGFLSEREDFAAAVQAAGLIWVGPPPDVMARLGRKDAAKVLARTLGVPVVPGFEATERLPADGRGRQAALDELAGRAQEVGFPLLIKAVAGGGGRGMRIVRAVEQLDEALALAAREAESAFGDGTLLIERYIERGRHIEVQVLADAHDRVIHLGERECSIQRRHQKIMEESPSPRVDADLRDRLGKAAVALAHGVGYVSAGTVEFLLDDATGLFYFLEVNTRLQVEHPVTEAVTGLDLVDLQLRIACGEHLPLHQDDVRLQGHAIEVRICAEDPSHDFAPQAGQVLRWHPPRGDGLRVDHGLWPADRVPLHYDAMVAKVIAHGPDRGAAIARLTAGLRRLQFAGIANNRSYLLAILQDDDFAAGHLDTHFVARHPPSSVPQLPADAVLLAAALWLHGPGLQRRLRTNPWRADVTVLQSSGYDPVTVHLQALRSGRFAYAIDRQVDPLLFRLPQLATEVELLARHADATGTSGEITLLVGQLRHDFAVVCAADALWLQDRDGAEVHLTEQSLLPEPKPPAVDAGSLVAQVAGVVTQVLVAVDDLVDADQPLVAMEAMKMLTVVRAPGPATVRAVFVAVGDAVAAGTPLIELDENC